MPRISSNESHIKIARSNRHLPFVDLLVDSLSTTILMFSGSHWPASHFLPLFKLLRFLPILHSSESWFGGQEQHKTNYRMQNAAVAIGRCDLIKDSHSQMQLNSERALLLF